MPGPLTVNSIVKASKQDKFFVFIINNPDECIWVRKGSTICNIEKVKECNFVNIKVLNQQEQQTSLKVSFIDDMKQKIIISINHRETVEDLIEQNVDLFAKKDTDLGRTNTIKMSIDAGNHLPI